MLPQEWVHLNQKVTFCGHKGVFAIALCLEGFAGHEDAILHNAVEKIGSLYIIGMAEQQNILF